MILKRLLQIVAFIILYPLCRLLSLIVWILACVFSPFEWIFTGDIAFSLKYMDSGADMLDWLDDALDF